MNDDLNAEATPDTARTTGSSTATASVEFRVPFHDCDPLQIVWHGNYLRYFELARTKLFQQLQLDVPDIRDLGYTMFVTETHCRYLYPLRYNDKVMVRARFSRVGAILRVSYGTFNVTKNRKSARAYTELAFTDRDGEFVSELPEVMYERILDV